jgi:hypothetical protein
VELAYHSSPRSTSEGKKEVMLIEPYKYLAHTPPRN